MVCFRRFAVAYRFWFFGEAWRFLVCVSKSSFGLHCAALCGNLFERDEKIELAADGMAGARATQTNFESDGCKRSHHGGRI
jgi:hypothetical protein